MTLGGRSKLLERFVDLADVSATALLATAAVLAVAVAAVLVIALHLLPTGLDPTRNAVSQYGRTGTRACIEPR